MQAEFKAENNLVDGKPAGGFVKGTGLEIEWQNGPLGRDKDCCNRDNPNQSHAPGCKGIIEKRFEPNGAFVETVIAAALQRIEHYQSTQFKCRENAIAITKLEEALLWLNSRTQRREKQGVEGTHGGN